MISSGGYSSTLKGSYLHQQTNKNATSSASEKPSPNASEIYNVATSSNYSETQPSTTIGISNHHVLLQDQATDQHN